MNTSERGCYTEAVIIAELLKVGYELFKPVAAHSRCDLVVVIDGDFRRAQCKTARIRHGSVRFNTYSQCGSLGAKSRRGYKDDVDVFLAYCEENSTVYIVPVTVTPASECYLRVEPTKNNQSRGILWAKDFTLSKPGAVGSIPASPPF